MKRIHFFVTVFLISLPLLTSAQDKEFSKVGTTAAQFLKVDIGARALAMGGAFSAFVGDATALYWNPAGIALLQDYELTVTHTQWIADISHDFAGFVFPLGRGSAVGLSAVFQNSDEMEITTVEQPRGTGETFDVSDLAIGISYARAMTDFINVGITAKFIQQRVWHESASTIGIDLGALLNTGFRGIKLAMVMTNFGSGLKLDGRDLIRGYDQIPESVANPNVEAKLSTEPWPLPTNFRASVAFNAVGGGEALLSSEINRLTMVIDVTHPNDHPEYFNLGAEYALNEQFFGRIGYRGNADEEGLTFGGGIKISLSGGAHLTIDYAYTDFGVFDYVQHFTAGFTF